MAYLDRQRLIQAEDAGAPDTRLGLEIPDALNPASPAYRYRKGPSLPLPAASEPAAPVPSPASRRPDIQYNQAGKPMIWRKGVTPDPEVTRTRARLLSNTAFEGRFRDRAPSPVPWVKEKDSEPEPAGPTHHESMLGPHSENTASTESELLAQRPRDMHRDVTEFESIQSLMEQTPGETRGTNEDMDSMVAPRLTRIQMRNQTPNYWPGSTDPREFDADWDPREAVVHPDRADNRRRKMITSRGAPTHLIKAMDRMFVEHTGESNPFSGPEASKRIRK